MINDVNIVLSIINMKLRDFYSNLDDLKDNLDDAEDMIDLLNKNNYYYDKDSNQFKLK